MTTRTILSTRPGCRASWMRGCVAMSRDAARWRGCSGWRPEEPCWPARHSPRRGSLLRHANALLQQAKADLAAPDTPLGRAQADAVRASTEGPQDGSAYRAVAAAKQFKGSMVTMTYEFGLQALEPRNFSGPLWQDLTGISSTVVELGHPDQYSKPIAEHIAQSGAYDVIDIEPSWIPSLADGGVIAPIDDYVSQIHEQG